MVELGDMLQCYWVESGTSVVLLATNGALGDVHLQREREGGMGNSHFSSPFFFQPSVSTSVALRSNLRSKTHFDPQYHKETARYRSEENSQDGPCQHPKAHLTQTSVVSPENALSSSPRSLSASHRAQPLTAILTS